MGDKGSVVLLQIPYFVGWANKGKSSVTFAVGFPISKRAWRIWRMSSPLCWASVLARTGSWKIGRRVSCTRNWPTGLASSGIRYSCKRGRMSRCSSSRPPAGVYRGPVLLECQGVGASPCRSMPAASRDWSRMRSCLKGLGVLRVGGPNVSLKLSLGRVSFRMISATPPIRALL